MINVFNLKEGDRLVYRIPKEVEDEHLKQFNGNIVEVIKIDHVFDSETFDAVLKFIVRNEKNNDEYTLSTKTYAYLKYAPEKTKPNLFQLEDRIKKLEKRIEKLEKKK